ncbi:hypothetical protein [Weissella paramesenteroides]|uniref:hypothetical protein n=1 Tax=Weissella paramesenteroides TaxID=1249 RepID=UPI003F745686
MFFDLLLLTTLLALSYQDFYHQHINSLWLILPLLVGALFYRTPIWLLFLIYCFCLVINTLGGEHYIGNGDLDVLATLSLYVTFQQFWFICTIACACQLVFHLLTRKQMIAFIPAITMGYIVFLVQQIWIK